MAGTSSETYVPSDEEIDRVVEGCLVEHDPLAWEIKFYAVGMRQVVTQLELERFVDKQMLRHGMPRVKEPPLESGTAKDT